jgi:hypothetical protein
MVTLEVNFTKLFELILNQFPQFRKELYSWIFLMIFPVEPACLQKIA